MADQPAGIACRAAQLLADAGAPRDALLLPLAGGGNNRVYRVASGGRSFLLKEYFRHPGDRRDRLGSEFGFARFAWDHGVRCIPEPIACDAAQGVALYDFVEGAPIAAGEIALADIEQAAAFARALDGVRLAPGAQSLPDASEACFCVAAHLDLVEMRLQRLLAITPLTELDKKAKQFVETELCHSFEQVRFRIDGALAGLRIPAVKELTCQERTISPSDFGFHNALRRRDGTLVFLDFEYAGWDDPAKLVCDFFCQVAVPVPPSFQERFIRAVANQGADRWQQARLRLLMPLYRIKWCCIVLNHFLPVDVARRRFASRDAEVKKLSQLKLARNLLQLTREMTIIHEGV